MSFLEVSTTIGCPLRCSYCPQGKIIAAYSGPRLLSLETFAAALANCPPTLAVSFAGYAEPYLNRQCSAMIELAAGQGREVLVYTTGVGMDDGDVEVLTRIRPRILMLHLPDGGGDMKAKVDGEYVGRLRRLAAEVPGFQSICYGAPRPLLGEFGRYGKGYPLHSRAGNVVQIGAPPEKRGPLRCRPAPGLDENVLLPDGRLSLCCQDWNLVHVVGDLTKQTWDEIHAGPELEAVRALMREGDCLCRTCEFAESV